ELFQRRRADLLEAPQRAQERAPARRPDARQLVEDGAELALLAQLAVVRDREAVRLVAHALQEEERGRVRRERQRILHAREEHLLALRPAVAQHARRGRLLVALLGQRGQRDAFHAEVREERARRVQLPLAAVEQQEVGRRLGGQLLQPAAEH